MPSSNSPQTYQLYIDVQKSITLKIGRLGIFDFPAGFYVYTGSARRGMENRLARHLAREKKLRWHIDFLLNHPAVSIVEIRKFTESECFVNARTRGDILIPGFGASDCRAKCGSHLKFINT